MRPLLTFLVALILAACAPTDAPAAGPSLDGTNWTLTKMAGWTPSDPKHTPTMRFADGRVGGRGGCNTYGGEYQLNGDKIRFGRMMSTLMACIDGAGAVEQAFHQMLGEVRFATISGDTLIFSGENRAELAQFARTP